MFKNQIDLIAQQIETTYREAYGKASSGKLLAILENAERVAVAMRETLDTLHLAYTEGSAVLFATKATITDLEEARKATSRLQASVRASMVDIMRSKIPSPDKLSI